MNIHLFGAGFKNKGAQLMLATACDWLRLKVPGVRLAVSGSEATAEQASVYDLELLSDYRLHVGHAPRMFDLSWNSPRLYRLLKQVRGAKIETGQMKWSEVDIILDLSGLAYSEKWGSSPIRNLGVLAKKCKESGKKYVLMPQAFGPFSSEGVKKAMGDALTSVDIAFARDLSSYNELQRIAEKGAKVIQCSDMTHLLTVENKAQSRSLFLNEPYFTIVPNARMLDKAGEQWKIKYLDFLEGIGRFSLVNTDYSLLIMIHSTNAGQDRVLGEELSNRLKRTYGERVKVWTDNDPLVLKLVLKNSYFVVGSRFHALVSALSSGTPCIGTSWQHKYQHLFEEYGVEEFLIMDATQSPEVLLEKLLDGNGNESCRKIVVAKSIEINQKVADIFEKELLPVIMGLQGV